MPIFLPPFIMNTLPSTMSFLYIVGGKLMHHNPILSDAKTSEEWDTLSKVMIPNFSWDTYTSTITNIKIYKGIASTLKIVNHLKGQYIHSDEIGDDATNEEEWSTISKYMTPSISWETYTSTITDIGTRENFNRLEGTINRDLESSKFIFNIKNQGKIDNIGEWVVYVRELRNLLSTPSAIARDYNSTILLYPKKPSTIYKEENFNDYTFSRLNSTLMMFSTLKYNPTNDALISSMINTIDSNHISSFINNIEIQSTIQCIVKGYF
jgi:hypothetical protein